MLKPNTFIIGAQKSATTSLYNWIAQHPDICAPNSLKDYPIFLSKNHSEKEIESFEKEYFREGYKEQKIILQGCVNYMFYRNGIENVYSFNPESKLICVLRNPTDRAISAYNYFKKLNLENLSLKEALLQEESRAKKSQRQKNNFTYKAHGLYFEQLEFIYSIFRKEQVLVLLYDDLKTKPEMVIKQTFDFLKVDNGIKVETKKLNVTGEIKHKPLHDLLFKESKIRKFIVDNFIDPILPIHRRTNLKLAFLNWNTKKNKKVNENSFEHERNDLKQFFKQDIEKLEKLIGKNLDHWK